MAKTYREPCGCTSTESRWIELCAEHKREHAELHARAASDRRAAQHEAETSKLIEDLL